jgi:hypothetical protein
MRGFVGGHGVYPSDEGRGVIWGRNQVSPESHAIELIDF